jgi:hypothetical protein
VVPSPGEHAIGDSIYPDKREVPDRERDAIEDNFQRHEQNIRVVHDERNDDEEIVSWQLSPLRMRQQHEGDDAAHKEGCGEADFKQNPCGEEQERGGLGKVGFQNGRVVHRSEVNYEIAVGGQKEVVTLQQQCKH